MIKIYNPYGVTLDNHIKIEEEEDSEGASNCPVIIKPAQMYVRDDEDKCLGFEDKDLIRWKRRQDYTGHHLPHYLNYFMIHLVDGYLQTGKY